MKQFILTIAAAMISAAVATAQNDTLRVSSLFTTHIIFSTDVSYADMSNSRTIAAKVVEQNKNMIALKAREPFSEPCSVSALESNGKMWTFIVVSDEHPEELIVDTRKDTVSQDAEPDRATVRRGRKTASTWKTGDAPGMEEVSKAKRQLYHIVTSGYGITASCENLFSYLDITYMTLSVENSSGISYQINDATFVIESRKHSKRTVEYDQTVFPKSKFGSLSAGPGKTGRIVYSFDKMTLSLDQVLRIYLYETGGQRNLVLSVAPDDINKARTI